MHTLSAGAHFRCSGLLDFALNLGFNLFQVLSVYFKLQAMASELICWMSSSASASNCSTFLDSRFWIMSPFPAPSAVHLTTAVIARRKAIEHLMFPAYGLVPRETGANRLCASSGIACLMY